MDVSKIEEGLVLDHIKAGMALKIYESLKLDLLDCPLAILTNVDSKLMGKKDILKIGALVPIDLAVLGFWDEHMTLNIIRDGEVAEKVQLEKPSEIRGLLECKNPRCITGQERAIESIFYLADREKDTYRCAYCDSMWEK